MSQTLVVLAAGLSTRYGRLKQLDPLGPSGEAIMDYNIYDAARAGFDEVVLVVRPEIEEAVREHLRAVVGDALPCRYVHQRVDDLPEGFRAPSDRAKPWGTGHAVLRAAREIEGAFAVCNADDLYGPGAFRALHGFLYDGVPRTEAALVGYTLAETLSGSGGVARGICVLGREGLLARISEVRQIRRIDGWITGITLDGEPIELTGEEIVSMNLWGFTPPVVELLGRQFRRFLTYWGADTTQEFYLSTAVNGQIEIGATRITVLHAEEHWFGVTHAGDRDRARETLAERVRQGAYPEDLAAAFRALR